jgi:hypothetical protein
MLQNPSSKTFSEHLNTAFQVPVAGGAPILLELFEVTDRNDSPRLEQFSLIFRGPMATPIRQGLYRLDHEKLGEVELFLVPIGPNEERFCYQAIFNRFRK